MKIISTNKNILKQNIFTRFVPLITIISILIIVPVIITASTKKTIIISTNGNDHKVTTYKSKVSDVLESNNITIEKKDKITPALSTKLVNNQIIKIKKAIYVKVIAGGKIYHYKSAEKNINDFLTSEKIKLNSKDILMPSIKTPLTQNLCIRITRVSTKISTKLKPIEFSTTIKVNNSLPNTLRKVIFSGLNGQTKYTYENIYHDNKLYKRKLLTKVILRHPLNKIIVQGGYPVMPVSSVGKPLSYYKKLRVRATAYWAVRGVGRTFTGSGRRAVRNPHGYSTIAVDKHLFPFGTRLFIEGYGFAVAADTGTSIIGNTIDVFFNTRQEARSWAVKHPLVYVLK